MRERGEERVIRRVLIIGRLVEDRLLVPLRRHKPSPWLARGVEAPRLRKKTREEERGRESGGTPEG